MDMKELMIDIRQLLEDARTAVLATVGHDGKPHLRWMTPAVLPLRPGALYTVSAPNAGKITDLQENPCVEWMIQNRSLTRVINVRGRVNILDNPSLKSEVLEILGQRLFMFWKTHSDPAAFVVLETVVEEAWIYSPMRDRIEYVRFDQEG